MAGLSCDMQLWPGIKGRVHVTQGFHGFSVKSSSSSRGRGGGPSFSELVLGPSACCLVLPRLLLFLRHLFYQRLCVSCLRSIAPALPWPQEGNVPPLTQIYDGTRKQRKSMVWRRMCIIGSLYADLNYTETKENCGRHTF